MSDETNSEVKVEAATEPVLEVVAEVAAEVETKPADFFFDIFEVVPTKDPEPVEPEPTAKTEPPAEPVDHNNFSYEGHQVRFSSAGECFIEKDGQCLGFAAGAIADSDEAKNLIDGRVNAAVKGE